MKIMSTISIEISIQGDAVPGSEGYLAQISDTMATFYVDGWGKTGRIYPVSSSSSVFTKEGNLKHFPSITLEDGEDGEEASTFTEIYFPEFEGWSVFAVSGGKTMAVCLRKK
jgi:hypothetical protein